MKEFGIYVGRVKLLIIITEITNENVAAITFPAKMFSEFTNNAINKYLNSESWSNISGVDTLVVELNKAPESFKNYGYLGQLDKVETLIRCDMIDYVRRRRYFK